MTDGEITALFFARSESAVSSPQEKYGALMRSIAGGILSDPRDCWYIFVNSAEISMRRSFLCWHLFAKYDIIRFNCERR